MIFTKAAKERLSALEMAITDLRLAVGMRAKNESSLHSKFAGLEIIVNELGAAVGRIESHLKALSETNISGLVALRADISNHDKAVDLHLRTISKNQGEAREALAALDKREGAAFFDMMASEGSNMRADMTNNAIVVLSGRLSALEEQFETSFTHGDAEARNQSAKPFLK